MENYITILPEELILQTVIYLDNDYIINTFNDFLQLDIEKLFQVKYTALYTAIRKLINLKLLSEIDYIILYKDIQHINYDTIENILNNTDSRIFHLINFDIEDKIEILSPKTFDVIYTCLLSNVSLFNVCVTDIKSRLSEKIKNPYMTMYIYLDLTILNANNTDSYLEWNGSLIKFFRFLLMTSFINKYYIKNKEHDILLKSQYKNILYLSSNHAIFDKFFTNPLNDGYYKKFFKYCKHKIFSDK